MISLFMPARRRAALWPVLLLAILGAACRLAADPDQLSPTATAPVLATTPTAEPPFPTVEASSTPTLIEVVPSSTPTPTPSPQPTALRFAVIGDYGLAGEPAEDVANLVKRWQPDLIITTGDNNYPDGAAETIDLNVGQYYHEYIAPYHGDYGAGAEINRFFPTLGNHDWNTNQAQPYLDYFELPGNERYYDFTWGPVHFFALSSDSREPDGVGKSSAQADWLQTALGESTSPWQIVYGHHPPYSSGPHGSIDWMQWPFQAWGADVLFCGHNHIYERLIVDGFPIFINGVGGGPIYALDEIHQASEVRYNQNHGAMLVEASETKIEFQFITRTGDVIDSYILTNTE